MDDAQVQNALEAIQFQARSASSPAELAKLSMAASGLLSSANSSEMEDRIKRVQDAVEKRAQEVESAEASETISHNQEKGRLEKDETNELDSVAVANSKVYDKFRLIHKEELANKKKDTESLKELEEATKAGVPISEELTKKLIKTPEQIKVAKERSQQIVEAEKIAKAEAEFRAAEIDRLKKEINKSPPHKHKEIKAQIEQQETRQVEALSVMGEVHEHYNERLKQVEHIYNAAEAAKETGVNQESLDNVVKQFLDMMPADELLGIAGHTERIDGGNKEHVKWLKSQLLQEKSTPQRTREEREHMKEAIIQDPDVIKAIKNAANKYQKNAASSLSPPDTPNVIKPPSNTKGRGD